MARSTRRKPTAESNATASTSRRVTRSQSKAMKQQEKQQPKETPAEPLPPLTAAEWKKLNPKTEHYE